MPRLQSGGICSRWSQDDNINSAMHTENKQGGKRSKGKGGRPKKSDSKTAVLVVRMTPEERAAIEQKAIQAGIKIGEWFRKAAENATIIPRFTVEEIGYLRSLAGLCNNLNQLARVANREGIGSLVMTLQALTKKVAAYLDKLKNDDR